MKINDYRLQDLIDMLDEMLLDDEYEFADEFLRSVRSFIDETGFVTGKQYTAVKNIKEGVEKRSV